MFWGVFTGLGTGMMATVLGVSAANRRFVQRRGLVLGMLTAASTFSLYGLSLFAVFYGLD